MLILREDAGLLWRDAVLLG